MKRTLIIDGSSFLKHLAKFNNITDEEIERRASKGGAGIDAEEALLLYLERDFVRDLNKNIISTLIQNNGSHNQTK